MERWFYGRFAALLKFTLHATGLALFAALRELIVGRRTLKYGNCKGVTNYSAASNGILKILKAANKSVVWNLCFINCEDLMSKCIPPNITKVEGGGAKILNSIKKKLIETTVDHKQLLHHADVRWLSRAGISTRKQKFILRNSLIQRTLGCFL
jgi:hypothetical protein